MDILTILFGVILGMFLAIGDQVAIDHRARFGFPAGLFTWVLMVSTPLIVVWNINFGIALIAMVLGAVLSAMLTFQAYQARDVVFIWPRT